MRVTPWPDRRLIAEFMQATKNEILIDVVAYGDAHISPLEGGYLPRPARWIAKLGEFRAAIRPIATLINGVWSLTSGIPFYSFQLIAAACHKLRTHDRLKEAQAFKEFGLGLSIRAGDVIPQTGMETPACWIAFPWAIGNEPVQSSAKIDVFSLLTVSDLMRAWRLAARLTAAYKRRPSLSLWTMQSYTAFRWFCVRLALQKLDGHFVMAEHFDRWAILVDLLVGQKKRKLHNSGGRLTVVQHGLVGSLSGEADTSGVVLDRRLASVDTLYVYDLQFLSDESMYFDTKRMSDE